MINIENSLLLIIDVQEKLVKMLGETSLPQNVYALSKAAEILNIKTLVTEQYPDGLGKTLDLIKKSNKVASYYEKTSFSALQENNIKNDIINSSKKQIIICGIEAHICVLQTAVELQKLGYEVFFVNDCSASRKSTDFKTAIELLKQYNIKLVSKEIVIFFWLKSSKNKHFKEVQSLIK